MSSYITPLATLETKINRSKHKKIEFHVTGDGETNDYTIFVCVYMYIIMELDRQKYAFDNILKVIKSIKQSTLNEKNIRSNIALSLLEKDLHHLALPLDRCGVPYRPASSTDGFASWCQLICRGQWRLFKLLELNKDNLTTIIEIKPNRKSKAIKDRISIGSTVLPQ